MKTLKSKEQLEKSSQEYWEALQEDVHILVDRAKNIITGAVVVGLGFWLAYRLFKALYTQEDKKPRQNQQSTKDEPSVMSIVKQAILKELALFLLGLVKEKVVEYLQEINNDGEDS